MIVSTIFDQITAASARGGRVELRGFGAFTVTQRPARIGRNPRTRETAQVHEKAVDRGSLPACGGVWRLP